ncbi:MAG TPA: hypothetical protein PKE23_04590 [Anaerolineales bacterium]|nr:hypothetical protein [Anaerolineales bacterium]
MELNFATITLPTIVVWMLGLFIFLLGSLLGYFNMSIDARKKQELAEQKVEHARIEADRRIAEMQKRLDEADIQPAKVQQTATTPSLLTLKSVNNLQTQIEMDGQLLIAPLSPERKKRLVELINHFRPWLEGAASTSQPISKPLTTPLSEPLTNFKKPEAVPYVPPTVKPVPVILGVNNQKTKTDPESEFKLLSMVKQIDVVLQKRLAGTSLEPLGIHLNDSLQGGLEVQIGSQKFETIDDVPDANIKAAIRAAIAEWEQKYIPGQ